MNELTVVHVDTQTSWRGGERQVMELMKGIAARGHRNVLVCKPGSEIANRASEAGIETSTLPLRGEWDIISAYKLRTIIRTENADILHVHTSHAHTLGLMALWRMNGCRLVVSRRVDFHLHSMFSRKIKYGPSVARIITVSDAIRRVLVEDGVDPERVLTIRSGFVTGEFSGLDEAEDLRTELGIDSDTVVIATVAALAPHKAHYTLLKAAYHVIKTHPDVVFLLAGEGELQATIERDIKNLGLEKNVRLLGFVKNIGRVYKTADIFALSSREEGLCTSILDAMYFKLPIVATSAGGIPELVRDGFNGFIVPVEDFMSFADKLRQFIDDTGLRVRMGARSTNILEQNTIEKTIERTIEIYRSL